MEQKHSKAIRVSRHTWDRLDALRDWKMTFNQVIDHLLDMREMLAKVEPIIQAQKRSLEDKRTASDIVQKARLERADLESRTL